MSMGNLARSLGVSTPYLCNVELGKRGPLGLPRILKVSRALGLGLDDELDLIRAAQIERGFIQIPTRDLDARDSCIRSDWLSR